MSVIITIEFRKAYMIKLIWHFCGFLSKQAPAEQLAKLG